MTKKVVKKKTPTRKKTTSKKSKAAQRAATPSASPSSAVSEELIRARAFEIYRAGANPSNPEADWFQAERELRTQHAS